MANKVSLIDAHDREVIAWRAVAGGGISGSVVRDMMLEAVEARFGDSRTPAPIERLSDNGSPYTARRRAASQPSSTRRPASRWWPAPRATASAKPS